MMIGFILWSLTALLFLAIGFSCRKAIEPVGFFTFAKAPDVKNVHEYNKAVAKLWFVSAVVFWVIGIPLLLLEQNDPLALIVMFAAMIWAVGIMVMYLKIEGKYKK